MTTVVSGVALKIVGRATRADVVVALCLAVATFGVAAYFAPRGFAGGFVDMAHDGYQLQQAVDLSDGRTLFRDTFDQYGPLNGYLNTLGFVSLGRRLLAIKYFVCLWYAVTAVALFALARRWLSCELAALSGALWLGLAPFYQHGLMLSPHVYALLFQAIATLIALSAPALGVGELAAVGVFAGLSWSVKQSYGVLFLVAVMTYLFLCGIANRAHWGRVATAMAAAAVGYFAVVAVALAWLSGRGALHDWYLQTIAFPRAFYAEASAAHLGGFRVSAANAAWSFLVLQADWPSWVIMRAVVLITTLALIVRRQGAGDLLLIAPITAFLWFGAYPSANIMHQWWTASLSIAPFIACIQRISGAKIWIVAAVALCLAAPGLNARAEATAARRAALTEVLNNPPLLRGIRTDAQTKRAFRLLGDAINRYRSHHPGAGIVSIESSDGWRTGVAESLPILMFVDNQVHKQPVYWSLPVLTTEIYPKYAERLWNQIRTEQPLIINHHDGDDHDWSYSAVHIAGYTLLAVAWSGDGYWYLYAPTHADRIRHAEISTSVGEDGRYDVGFVEEDRLPTLNVRSDINVDGSFRGRITPSLDGQIKVDGQHPLTLVDRAVGAAGEPVNIYTWPSKLLSVRLEAAIIPPSPDDIVWRAGPDVIKALATGTLTIDGRAESRYAYFVQWKELPVEAGSYFVARGELLDGGVQIGVLKDGRWTGSVKITKRGAFEAILNIRETARYGLIVANCVESVAWAIGGRTTLRVRESGWIAPPRAPIGG